MDISIKSYKSEYLSGPLGHKSQEATRRKKEKGKGRKELNEKRKSLLDIEAVTEIELYAN